MIKWLIVGAVLLIILILGIRIIKVMLKTEKDSKKSTESAPKVEQPVVNEEYKPKDAQVNVNSATSSIVTDMSSNPDKIEGDGYEFMSNGFTDHNDDEFFDYSAHLHSKKKNRQSVDFDLDGEMADDFEYMPSSPDFSYLENMRPPKESKELDRELNELSTEMKVLMLSDIFDRKYF